MKKLIIFDLDGTLLDTLSDLHGAVAYALKREALPTRSIDEVRGFVGNGIRKLIERAVPAGSSAELTGRVFDAFCEYYGAHCMDLTAPYPGIAELLKLLKRQGYRLGVVSNKADAPVKALIQHYFPDVFDCVTGERMGVRRKPAPDSVLETMRTLSAQKAETLYIGDSEVDRQTAENAGCECVLVSWGFKDRAFLETLGAPVADSVPQLLALIQEDSGK